MQMTRKTVVKIAKRVRRNLSKMLIMMVASVVIV